MRVEVADPHAAIGGRLGLDRVLGDLLHVPVAPDRVAEGDAPGVVEAGQEPVRREDRQARVRQRDEAHEHLVVAALLRVDARGLVAVVAVGDQQLGRRQRRARGGDRVGVGDAPKAVRRPVVVGDRAERRAAQVRRDRRPGVAVVEREDRREVGLRRARQPQPVLLGPGVRALVRSDPARPVVLDANAREQTMARAAAAVGAGVVLLERPQGGLGVAHDDAVRAPARQRRGGVGVGIAAVRVLRQVDLDDVVGGTGDQLGALRGVDDVVGRRGDRGEATGAVEVVVESVKGRDVGHGGGGW